MSLEGESLVDTERPGGVVEWVRPDSIAAELGLEPGDRVFRVGDVTPRDYIDYRYLTAEAYIELRVIRRSGEEVIFEIDKDPDEDLGIQFTGDIFGGPRRLRRCANHCLFCFVDRLPAGLRRALYVKDDDFRLSFLHGNFITLTNVSGEDVDRIAGQRLTPLYISVHATEPEVRAALMGSPRAADVLGQMTDLIRRGITLHTQVVVCPGLNDGQHLEKTISDLVALRPGVASVGVVPVGLTSFGPAGSPVRRHRPEEARALLQDVLRWHARLEGFVYPADELFLACGRRIPGKAFYEGFPQLQNGIGLARAFLDDLGRLRRALKRYRAEMAAGAGDAGGVRGADDSGRAGDSVDFSVVTGILAAPLLRRAVDAISDLAGLRGEVVVAENEFLGPSVTVAGLLSGDDVLRAVRRKVSPGHGPVMLPGAALRSGSTQFLDDLTIEELSRKTGRQVVAAGWLPGELWRSLLEWKETV